MAAISVLRNTEVLGFEFVGDVLRLIYGMSREGCFHDRFCNVYYGADANKGGVVNSGTSLTSAPSVFHALNPCNKATCHI